MRTGTSSVLFAAALVLAMAACENAAAPRDGHDTEPSFMPVEPLDPPDDGGTTAPPPPPPFSPPPRPFFIAPMDPPLRGGFDNVVHHCEQVPHVGIAFSQDVTQGTPLYRWGVSIPGSIATFNIYTQFGQLVMSTNTQRTRDNCVIHHEPEEFSTSGFAPGYYYVYASYWSLSNNPPFESNEGEPLGIGGRYITVFRVR